jgi:hypothetical protein
MSNTNTGGPAFPGLHPSKECHYNDSGMTLRDYFAAKAMQSLLVEDYRIYKYEVVQRAYEMADLMLEERSK